MRQITTPTSFFISAIARLTHPATSRLDGELVVPWMIPSLIIHEIHCRLTRSLKGLLKPTLTGWQREVHPPSARDVLHLYPQLLNSRDDRSHHVATVTVEDEEGNDMVRRIGDVRFEDVVHPRDHHPLVHPGIILALIVVGCRVSGELRPRDPTLFCLTLENNCRWENCAITGNRYCNSCTLCVVC